MQRKNASNLDGAAHRARRFDLKPTVSGLSGRKFVEFGTVRPRVQIPGPRPILEFARLSGPLVFITVIATFVLSVQQSRQDDQMKESIARIKARGKQFDSEFSSQYEVPIEEAVKRLGQVPGAFIRIASWLSREIPQDFGT